MIPVAMADEPASFEAKVRRRGLDAIADSIDDLGLNQPGCREDRKEYVEAYFDGAIALSYLERRAPFIAQELRR